MPVSKKRRKKDKSAGGNAPHPHPDGQKAIDQVSVEVDEAVNVFARKIDADPPPRLIYHYTNDVGFQGIIETGKLWLSDIFDQNDPTELRHGLGPAIDLLHAASHPDRPETAQFSSNVREMLHGGIESVASYFICCFSKAGDDLGQWRAYADNGRGYALGFDAHELEQAFSKSNAETAGHMTFPITYDDDTLKGIHEQIVQAVVPLISLPRRVKMPTEQLDNYMSELTINLCLAVLRSAIFFKHKAYLNEQEYRFLELFQQGALIPDLKHRRRPYSLVRYREFDWRQAAPNALKEIVIGPAADIKKAGQYAHACVRAFHEYDGTINIYQSPIPYRAL